MLSSAWGDIVGPLLGGLLFDVDMSYPYVAGAAIMLVGVAISLMLGGEQRPAMKQLIS